MTDADLIYNALLRAERRAEAAMREARAPEGHHAAAIAIAIRVIREEIGNGLALRAPSPFIPAGLDAISGKVD